MLKNISKMFFSISLVTLSVLNASAPASTGDYIGATKVDNSTVRINFTDKSNNETGFYVSLDDVLQLPSLPANDETENSTVYTSLENLECDKTYTVKIWSYNDDGNSSKKSRAFNLHSTFGVVCPNPNLEPAQPGPYIGVSPIINPDTQEISETSVRVNFVDNSDDETKFRIVGNDINVTLPANDENNDSNVYTTLTNLTCNKVYTIKAIASNGNVDSLSSDDRSFNIHTTFGVDCNSSSPVPTAIDPTGLVPKFD